MTGISAAVVQRWDEHESGWGVRDDGWSIHADAAQHAGYLAAHAAIPTGDEWDVPTGDVYEVVVPPALWGRLAATRYGLRVFSRAAVPVPGALVTEVVEGQEAQAYLQRLYAAQRRFTVPRPPPGESPSLAP